MKRVTYEFGGGQAYFKDPLNLLNLVTRYWFLAKYLSLAIFRPIDEHDFLKERKPLRVKVVGM